MHGKFPIGSSHLRLNAEKRKRYIFVQLELRAQTDFEDRPNTFEHVVRASSFQLRTKSIRATILQPPSSSLLSSIVPHSDRHKVSSFVFVAESCELNPFPLSLPVRPLTTRMTDDERRRLIRIDVDIWIADTRILRHGTRFKPSSTRPGHPLREIRTLDSLARRGVKTREETRRRHKRRNGIERFLHIARLDGLPRAKPSFERHSSLEEREGRKGEWFTSGNIGRDGKKPWKRIEKLDEFSTRFCSTTATSRCGL